MPQFSWWNNFIIYILCLLFCFHDHLLDWCTATGLSNWWYSCHKKNTFVWGKPGWDKRKKACSYLMSYTIYQRRRKSQQYKGYGCSQTLCTYTLPTNTSNQHNQLFYCKSGKVLLIIVQSQDIVWMVLIFSFHGSIHSQHSSFKEIWLLKLFWAIWSYSQLSSFKFKEL